MCRLDKVETRITDALVNPTRGGTCSTVLQRWNEFVAEKKNHDLRVGDASFFSILTF